MNVKNKDPQVDDLEDEDLFLPEVLRLTKLNRSTLYHHMAKGLFPACRKIGRRACWLRSEVLDWKRDLPRYKPRPKVVRASPEEAARRGYVKPR
jgi:predicted DNA-binding transcriptional regulator AlpA